MNRDEQIAALRHEHHFGQNEVRDGERRTVLVVVITAVMMVVEIAAGLVFGSMALLADGLHMASHTAALGLALFAYVYARRHAEDARFSYGTGKVNALGGFAGAVLLAVFALMMAWESTARLLAPVVVHFDRALLVAVLGLVVNAASALILARGGHHHHEHGPHDDHDEDPGHHHHHHDHNLESAYLHVLADALTSILAIAALLAGKYFGMVWMDPAMGILGAILVARWSWGLVKRTSKVLLDHQAPERLRTAMIERLESDGETVVTDLHVRAIAPGGHAAEVVLASNSARPSREYRDRLAGIAEVLHLTIEVVSLESDD